MVEVDPEDYEEIVWDGKSGGGGGGKRAAGRKSKTVRKINKDVIEAGRRKRVEEASHEIKKWLGKVGAVGDLSIREEWLERYEKWLVSSLLGGEILNDSDLEWNEFTASVHAGGAGRQTSQNARRAIHVPTGIFRASEQSREASGNVEEAKRLLVLALNNHLALWKVLTEGKRSQDLELLVRSKIGELTLRS